jgi:hypothetical protein
MPKIDIRKTELVWLDKYDDDGKLRPVERPGPYLLQVVEVINSPGSAKSKLLNNWGFLISGRVPRAIPLKRA